MAIADDFTIDYVDKKITYTGTVTDGIPQTIYTVNELYSYLQDTFDEPAQMDNPIPMSAQTPTQYTLLNIWFMDEETVKALYSGSIQTADWTKSGANGITIILHDGAVTPPVDGDIGATITETGGSGAIGTLLDVSDDRSNVIWIRNTTSAQFDGGGTCSGGASSGWTALTINSGENIWANVFSVGTIQDDTEIYIGQEDDFLGGTAIPALTKITSWWDSDSDYTASTNGVAAGHFDILVKVQEGGVFIDDLNLTNQGRLAVFARQGDTIYTHFEFNAAVGNFVVPFASTGFDINQAGFGRVDIPTTFSGPFEIGEIITGGTSGAKARLTAFVTDTSLSYILVGKNLTEFSTAAEVITGETSLETATKDGIAPTDINGAVSGGVTVTVGHNGTFDIDQNGTPENYAIVIDCNSTTLATVYERVMYLTRRGSTDTILPEPGAGNEDGEFYRGAGDTYAEFDAETTGGVAEGETVTGSISSATAEVVAFDTNGTIGYMLLTNVKGVFVENDVVSGAGGDNTLTTVINSFVDNNAAPFGAFAGGRFFVARGVVLDNVLAADNNNWQTSTVEGTAIQPPTTILLTFAGLLTNDRVGIFEVATAGDIDIVKTVVGLASGAVGASVIELDSTVEQDVPLTGWIRVVDTGTPGKEERYEFDSISGTTVTLTTVAPGDGTADENGSSATDLLDAGSGGIGASFGLDGFAKVGHHIRNTVDNSEAVILRAISSTEIETTPLTGGTGDTWDIGDTYEINTIAFLIDAADTCYFPYIDETIASGTSIARTLKFAATTELVARARFSDPDIGGQRYLPFEILGQQLTNANLTITATKNNDTIAT